MTETALIVIGAAALAVAVVLLVWRAGQDGYDRGYWDGRSDGWRSARGR